MESLANIPDVIRITSAFAGLPSTLALYFSSQLVHDVIKELRIDVGRRGLYAIGGSGIGGTSRAAEMFDPNRGNWERLPDMFEARHRHTVVVASGVIYVCGGCGCGRRSMEWFDPAKRMWIAGPPMKEGRYNHAAMSLHGSVIVSGGIGDFGILRSVELFDDKECTWKDLPPMPTKRWCHSLLYCKGKILVSGGLVGTGQKVTLIHELDFSSYEWRTLSDTPLGCAAIVHDDSLYMYGIVNHYSTVESHLLTRFDMAKQEWHALPGMSNSHSGQVGGVLGKKIYVCGNNCVQGNATFSTEVFDPVREVWEICPSIPGLREYHFVVSMSGALYVCGGKVNGDEGKDRGFLKSFQRFDPHTGLWEDLAPMTVPRVGFWSFPYVVAPVS